MQEILALDPGSYSIAINLFVRLLGAIYVVVYFPFLFQIGGLIGKEGILPIDDFLKSISVSMRWTKVSRFYHFPTLFWFNASDTALYALMWVGMALGVLLMFGVCPPLILLVLYLVHLSITTAGRDFLSFGWETFLMEITISTILLTATTPYNVLGWINLNFLLFRFHFAAGASKILSRDVNWRNMTGLAYHYLTQPLPNTIAWYFHKLPLWFHKGSTAIMFYIELVVSLAIFSPPEVRLLVFIQLVGLQFVIWLTGNLSYLNHMTIVFCLILLHNRYLEPFFGPAPVVTDEPSPLLWQAVVSLLGAALLALQAATMWYFFSPNRHLQPIMRAIQQFHIAYRHGIFAVMTTKRYEIIVEGSDDGIVWKEYEFFYKPGDVTWRPRRISPYQPRIDWQAWFLPFGYFNYQWWFQQFLVKLLQGNRTVLKLLKHNPFPDEAPLYVRALYYDYEFTTFQEKSETGHWWKRRLMGAYSPVLHLKVPKSSEN